MAIQKIAVLGAGQMGNGITQVAACSGYDVVMIDIKDEFIERGIGNIEKSLAKLVSKQRMTQDESDAARSRISISTDRGLCSDADLVVEAVPEILELKQSIFSELDEHTSKINPQLMIGDEILVVSHGYERAPNKGPELFRYV